MKILLWAPYGAGNHYWGPGISAFNLYSSATDIPFDLYLAHGSNRQSNEELFKEQYQIFDMESYPLGGISQYIFLKKAKKWISNNVKNFDVVHVLSDFHYSFMPAYWSIEQGVPAFIKVTILQDDGKSSYKSKILGWKQKREKLYNDITGYIAISSEIKKNILSKGVDKNKIHLIPNGVDIKRFKPSDDQLALKEELNLSNKITIIFTGGICERKNPSLILKSLSKLSSDEKYRFQVLLIGPDRDNGQERKKVNRLINQHELSNTRIYGFQENIVKYYQASDIFVLPSKKEGLSNSLLEAMACGCSVMSTPVSGSTDVIRHGENGYLFRNEFELTKYLRKLCKNKQIITEQGRMSKSIIARKYSSRQVLINHLNLFKTTLSEW